MQYKICDHAEMNVSYGIISDKSNTKWNITCTKIYTDETDLDNFTYTGRRNSLWCGDYLSAERGSYNSSIIHLHAHS